MRFLKRLFKWLLVAMLSFVGLMLIVVIVAVQHEKEQTVQREKEHLEATTPTPAEPVTAKTTEGAVSAPPTQPPVIEPEPVKYVVVKDKDSSFGNRVRISLHIEATEASTEAAQIETMMVAARNRHRESWPHVVSVGLWTDYKDNNRTNGLQYSPDGCGWTGEPCTGDIWTGVQRGKIPADLTRWGTPTDEETAAGKEKSCRNELQCWGDKHHLAATFACQPLIENSAKYSYEWTDGWLGAKLSDEVSLEGSQDRNGGLFRRSDQVSEPLRELHSKVVYGGS